MSDKKETCADLVGPRWTSFREELEDLGRRLNNGPLDECSQDPPCKCDAPDDKGWYDGTGSELMGDECECPCHISDSVDWDDLHGGNCEEYCEPLGMDVRLEVKVLFSTNGPEDYVSLVYDKDDVSSGPLSGRYHYKDWFDSAHVDLAQSDLDVFCAIYGSDIECLLESQ